MIERRKLLGLLAAAPLTSVFANTYPTKPIRLIVPFPAGGSIDMVGRMVGKALSDRLGQPVIVDNRSGAAGNIGIGAAAKAPADGYTLLMGGSAIASNLYLYKEISYDPVKDLLPISRVVDQALVLVVNPSMGISTVAELIARAKAKPGGLKYGSAGVASAQHFSGEMFTKMTGTEMLHVPYKGGAPAVADLLSGQIDLVFDTSPTAVPFIKSGKLVALGVTTTGRLAALPNVPTLSEAGLSGFEMRTWIGLVGPSGLPQPILDVLAREMAAIKKMPAFQKTLEELSLMPIYDTPADF
ncbi:MAG TPA: tripartite tricarboxylate transporter substrate binding protein, partial [Bellilinea sp.]|nr:tripartite tricarboxylate transporter substrate binding protein [Bellilinea sp.]